MAIKPAAAGLLAVLLALCALALPAAAGLPENTENAEKPEIREEAPVYRCLAVGIDRFVSEENTAPCSANNAEMMAALFADSLPGDTRITRRVNGPGTADEMETLLKDVFGSAGENDVSCLYFSTHGIIWDEEEGKKRTALILSDGDREEALEPRLLRAWLDRIPGGKVLILDCCHAGAMAGEFRGAEYRVLAGCGEEEDCYFWAAGEATGMGYFTAALENALRAASRKEIDPDGNGKVSLAELAGRIREIYGVSTPVFLPEESGEFLFRLPEDRKESERIQDLAFGETTEAEGQKMIRFHFRTETSVKIEYRLIPRGENGWEFDKAITLPDRERQGLKRGVVSPGEKDRTVKISRERLGPKGRALLQIVSYRGVYGQVPIPECTRIITTETEEK